MPVTDNLPTEILPVEAETWFTEASALIDAGETELAGLGSAATRDVGTSAGTVAAGDDNRLSNERVPVDGSVSTAKIADGAVTESKMLAPRRVFETAQGVWTGDAPAGRVDHVDTMEFIGVHDPTDVTDGIATPANIVSGDVWRQTTVYVP